MELLAVITILALLTGIAVPNIVSTINNNKRDTFLLDAKRMVSKAKALISSNREDRNNLPVTYTLERLNEDSEFGNDSDGGEYDASSYVRVSLVGGQYNYCVCVLGSKRKISKEDNCSTASACVDSEVLTGIEVVKDK